MKLKEYLKLNNLTVTDLAKATNIPHPTLLSYVNETHEPSLKNALKIHNVTLGVVSLDELTKEGKDV